MMGTMASTAKIGEKPFASWKKIGACASGAVWAKAMMTPAKSATVTARTWTAASSRRASRRRTNQKAISAATPVARITSLTVEVEATADGDERGRPGQQGVRPQDVADDAQARRIDRPVDVRQPAASQEEGDQGRRSGQDERRPRPDRLREQVHEGGGDPDPGAVRGIGEADGGRARDAVVGQGDPGQRDRDRESDAACRQEPADDEQGSPFAKHRQRLAHGQQAESDQEHAPTPTEVADDATDQEAGRLGDDDEQVDRLDLRAGAEGGLDGRRRRAEDMGIEPGRERGQDGDDEDAELLPIARDVQDLRWHPGDDARAEGHREG